MKCGGGGAGAPDQIRNPSLANPRFSPAEQARRFEARISETDSHGIRNIEVLKCSVELKGLKRIRSGYSDCFGGANTC